MSDSINTSEEGQEFYEVETSQIGNCCSSDWDSDLEMFILYEPYRNYLGDRLVLLSITEEEMVRLKGILSSARYREEDKEFLNYCLNSYDRNNPNGP
jgi:hypothetical protein